MKKETELFLTKVKSRAIYGIRQHPDIDRGQPHGTWLKFTSENWPEGLWTGRDQAYVYDSLDEAQESLHKIFFVIESKNKSAEWERKNLIVEQIPICEKRVIGAMFKRLEWLTAEQLKGYYLVHISNDARRWDLAKEIVNGTIDEPVKTLPLMKYLKRKNKTILEKLFG